MTDVELNHWFFSGDVVLSYLALAGATCMVYDYITTLDIEIEVNRPKWKIPQGLFFLNRYAGLGWQMYIIILGWCHLYSSSCAFRFPFAE
ncbi:hypothetical protein BDN70DRAFT_886358 [Pholiota conissans]|uniref:DUF6533 domain-containing protein n=1 Tax=Pholiota conissans TaxID=109636 RepID=A0A9P5YSP8_9AGAR|nr:hypothetical protein BDN70DRAFT_886358 [Pholiota conissans]